jgi:5-formyltetrahydrofolate cyclo-ligase
MTDTLQAPDQDRKQLRKQLIARRLAIGADQRQAATQQISHRLSELIAAKAPATKTIGVCMPHRGEVDLRGWMAVVDFQGLAALALPVTQGPQEPLRFAKFRIGDALIKDAFGIEIPARQEWVAPDVLVIPCVGFSRQRVRLGYGGGYYDRTLAAMRPAPLTIGIAFACQECMLTQAPHDAAMDYIVTELDLIGWPAS